MDRITGSTNPYLKTYQKNLQQVDKSSASDKSGTTKKKDALELSGVSREIKTARQEMGRLEESRRERVNELKDSLARGTYDVSGQEIADKMVSQLNFDRGV